MTPLYPDSTQDQTSGSLSPGEPEFLAIGKLHRPHGVRGEMILSVWTDSPESLIPGAQVYVDEGRQELTIRSARPHGENLLIAFEEYPQREQAGLLRNQILMARAADLPPLDDGELYIHELLGLQAVESSTGKKLGEVTEILETGANDVLVVRGENGAEILLPDIDSVVLDVDLEKREIRVNLLPGLVSD